jgi:hypothetical protein
MQLQTSLVTIDHRIVDQILIVHSDLIQAVQAGEQETVI